MPLTFVTYTATGGQTDFVFNKGYINTGHVKVYVDDVLKTITTDYTWFDSETVRFNSGLTAAQVVHIARETSIDARLVDWTASSPLDETSLDNDSLQAFYMGQEARDRTMNIGTDGNHNAASLRITNLANGTSTGDAINLGQLQAQAIAAGNLPTVGTGQNDYILVVASGAWAVTTPAAARTALDVQQLDAQLTDIAGLAVTDSGFIVGDGANFVLETGATVRTSLGLGTAATLNVGVANTNVIQADATGLPVIDGSQLTGINTGAQGSSLVLLETVTASASATIDLTTGIDSTYKQYVIELIDIVPVTDNVDLYMRFSNDGGSTFEADAGDYEYVSSGMSLASARTEAAGSATFLLLNDTQVKLGSDVGESYSGTFIINNPASATNKQSMHGRCTYVYSGGTIVILTVGGTYLTAEAINGIRLLMSSGNIESGIVKIYGVK